MKNGHTWKRVGLWMATVALAAMFLMAGSMKLAGAAEALDAVRGYGYPGWFAYAVGTAEIAGAVLLLSPRVATPGAMVLGGVMLGATLTHVGAGEPGPAVFTGTILLALATVGHLRRADLAYRSSRTGDAASAAR